MTYLCLLYIEISKLAVQQNAVKSILQAVELTKKHKELAESYETGAEALLEWIEATRSTYENVAEGASGHGDTSAKIGENMAAFVGYRRATKPPKKQELDASAGILATLSQSCENNFRPKYAPPAELAPELLAGAWKALEATEGAYETSISASFARFVGLEELLGKVRVKMAKTDAFLDEAPPAVFGATEYGATAAEATGLLESCRLTASQLDIASEVPARVDESLAGAEGVELHASYGAVAAARGALAGRFPSIADLAAARARKLEVAIAEFEKRRSCDDVLAWIDDQIRVFKLKDESVPTNTMIEVTRLELHLDREFKEGCELYREKWAAIVPYEGADASAAAVAGLEARLAEDLLDTKERYSVVAGDLAAKGRDLELFLRTPIFVDSEADVVAATATYDARVDDAQTEGTLTSLQLVFNSEASVLGAKLQAAIDAGEEDAAGSFERYDVPDLSKLLMELDALAIAYRDYLEELLALEREKERLRVLFAGMCDAEKDKIAAEAKDPFVFEAWVYKESELLAALRAKRETWTAMKDAAVLALSPVAEELAARGVMANPHTSESVTTIRLTYELQERDTDELVERAEALVADVAKLEERKAEYVESAGMFRDWIDGVADRYRNVAEGAAGFGASSAAVKASLEKFYEYKTNEKVDLQSTVGALTKSLAELHADQARIFHDAFSPPTGLSAKLTQMGLVGSMTALETVDKPYEAALRNAHLRICQIEADLQTMDARLDTCNDFIAEQKALFDSHNYGDNLATVNALLENVHLDKKLGGVWDETLSALKATASEVQQALHVFDLNFTSRVPTVRKAVQDVSDASTMSRASKRQSIKSCMDEVGRLEMALGALENDADVRYEALQKEVEALADVADKSREYATAAVELDVLYSTLEEELAAEPSGSLGLANVEAQIAAFDKSTTALAASIDEKFAEMAALAEFLTNCGYAEARAAFGRFTVRSLSDRKDACLKAVVDRGELFRGPGGILEIETAREKLRVDFAAAAREFRDDTASKAAKIEGKAQTPRGSVVSPLRRMSKMFNAGPKVDLDVQLAGIRQVKKDYDEGGLLAPCEALATQLEAQQIRVNPHTRDNIFTLRAAGGAFADNYKRLEASLLAQKAVEEGRKISPEKLAEIRENFDEFDSTGDGELTESEFHSGLTSVGIAMSKEKVQENFEKLKDPDTGRISDVLTAFGPAPQGRRRRAAAPVISMGMLARSVHDHDLLEYLTANMPKAEPPKNGEGLYYDCTAFVADLFKQ
ncbi:hypothetical protein JL720_637 [Aureococcus anophagefferens]|nr:hypothetical protein JL720_637 [Aureococcus anophagefferens]